MNAFLRFRQSILLLATTLVFIGSAPAATVNQTINLRPGWNAVWFEVTPTNTSPSAVFAGANIDSVWGWSARLTTAAFIQDSAEPVWNADQMLMFVPTNRVESFQNNLHAILGNRPYLVKLLGGATVTLTITGEPVGPTLEWQTDSFNLRGFSVDPFVLPTFLNFFRHSPAHFNSTTSQLQPIYTLNASGNWTLVTPTDVMQSGIAYWVKCNGASDYVAPVDLKIVPGGQFDFGLEETELTVEVINRRNATSAALLSGLVIGTPPGAINLVTSSPQGGINYQPAPNPVNIPLGALKKVAQVLQLDRSRLPSDDSKGVVTLTDGQGTRLRIPFAAQRITRASESDPALAEAKAHAGLWIGYVSVTGVSEAHSGPLTTILKTNQSGLVHEEVIRTGVGVTPTPVSQPFKLKLMLHVDATGKTRLLKEVIQMFAEGVFTNDVDGIGVLKQPGRYALITDETLIPRFTGSQVVDGKPVGRRLSTADFDFPGTATNNFVLMDGLLAVSNVVSGSITLSSSFATNPFRHKFHPDHDELGPNFASASARPEVYEVTRQIELMLTSTNPDGPTQPRFGDEIIGGTYKETVSGLHRVNIHSAGAFSLRRISSVGALNQ